MWLGYLAKEMKDTLKEMLVECLDVSKKGAGTGVDPSKYPSQVIKHHISQQRTSSVRLLTSPIIYTLHYVTSGCLKKALLM